MTDTDHIPESDFGNWRARTVIDTRSYALEADGRYHPVPGSGEPHACAACGRTHEVWAILEKLARDERNCAIPGDDGRFLVASVANVGVQCAKKMGLSTMA